MQPTPFRLSQALWTAFRAAKPVHRPTPVPCTQFTHETRSQLRWSSNRILESPFKKCIRAYSDSAKQSEIDRKTEDAKQRIEQSLDARADVAQAAEPKLKKEKDETIVHTLPEASSIVYTKDAPSDTVKDTKTSPQEGSKPEKSVGDGSATNGYNHNKYAAWASSQWQGSPLPSQIADLRSRATKRFSHFMDNMQSQIVVAAHHINDLTGYTGIERLKKEIEAQEAAVQNARQGVKDRRSQYSEAISMRATTQREVNDLLHRKHAWSPTDLERFTTLYRSDHANEQAEAKSHQELTAAEARYEEASTRLAKSILARYHEEQIWSDKIRQMSTWGTWGLMGLNVLLFIVFQIAIEPWRRRRLVKGFEDKVQAALDEKEKSSDEKFAVMQAQRNGDQIVQEAVHKQPEGMVVTAAEEVAAAIADAVSGATEPIEQTAEEPATGDTEVAIEQVTQQELEAEAHGATSTLTTDTSSSEPDSSPASPDTPVPATTDDTLPTTTEFETPSSESNLIIPPQTWQEHISATYHHALRIATQAYAHYSALLQQQFDDKQHVVLSRRELTTRVLEGIAAGAVVTFGFLFVVVGAR